jgi:Possible hemagglutinin (DUF637)/Contact-dependent growth inhibition CdiA C-terminal domain
MQRQQAENARTNPAAALHIENVKLAHAQWDYKQQGLTKEGAVIVAVVVAYFTAGAASGVGATAGNAAAIGAGEGVALAGGGSMLTGTGALISTVVGGAVTAGLTTLATQASVSLINNQGDLGATLKDLGSQESVKALVTAVVTGGVLAGMNFSPTGQPTVNGGAQTFTNQLGQNLKAGIARTLVSTAINGGSLEDGLKGAITTAFIDTAAAQGAFSIGQNGPQGSEALNAFGAELAHAIAGCAAGAASASNASGNTGGGCSAGAIGSVVGHLSAQFFDPTATGGAQTVQLAGMMSAIAAAVAGQDAAGISLAAGAGSNVVANNWLQPKEQELRRQAQRACAANTANACAIVTTLNALDAQREASNSGTFYKGVSTGLLALLQSPVTVPVELIASIAQNGLGDTTIALLRGVALLPTNIALGLQSEDPEVRGRVMVDALATTAGAAAVTRAGARVWTTEAPGILSGPRTTIPPLSDAITTRSLILKNQSADILVSKGFKVEQNPNVSGAKNPDYRIEGVVYDNYAPSTASARNAASEIGRKVVREQANNVVVNLTDSSITPVALQTQLTQYPIAGLNQVIIIDKAGTVIFFRP